MSANRALSPRMIGRQAQLDDLDTQLQQVRTGFGRIVFVAGDAGIGKTRLLQEFLRRVRAQGEVDVLEGHCYDEDPAVPYSPFVQAIRSWTRVADPTLIAQITEPWAGDLTVLMPELDTGASSIVALSEPQFQKQRLFAAIHHIIRPQNTEACRVVVLEDLHWSDQTSQELLRYLVRSIEHERLLILGTYRTDELHRRHPLTQLVAQFARERLYHEIRVAPLSHAELAAMLETTLDQPLAPSSVAMLYNHTDGNPFFVEEILKSLLERDELDVLVQRDTGWQPLSIPLSVRESILSRTTDLDAATTDVLTYAAVIGRSFDFDLLLRLTGLSEAELLQAVACLVERQLVVEDIGEHEDRYSFRHALTQEAVYDDLLGRERRMKHRAVLHALEALHGDAPELVIDQLAYHSLRAREEAKIARYAELAADRAVRLYAYREAMANYEVALEFLETDDPAQRATLLDKLGEAACPLGNTAFYIRCWREAQQFFQEAGDTRRVADLYRRIGRALWDQGKTDEAFNHTETARSLLEREPPGRELAMAYSTLSQLYMLSSRAAESIAWGERALHLARELGDIEVEVHALNNIGVSQIELGEAEIGFAYLERSLALALERGMAADVLRGYANLGGEHILHGQYAHAVTLLHEGVAFARRVGWESDIARFYERLAWAEMDHGNLQQAKTYLEQAEAEPVMNASFGGGWVTTKSELLLREGQTQAAVELLEWALVEGKDASDEHWLVHILTVLARGYLVLGDKAQAQTAMDRCIELCRTRETFGHTKEDALYYGIEVYLQLDQHESARSLLHHLLAVSQAKPTLLMLVLVTDAQGLMAAYEQRAAEAVEFFQQTASYWQRLEFPFDEVQARRRLAEQYLCLGSAADQERARQELAQARTIAARLGAAPELAAIDALIATLGASSEAIVVTPQKQLTRREREVIALLVRGYTNREIAEDLVISTKTAEVHVSNILGKLGFNSRAQAAAFAVEHGLADGVRG